ncbi:MAG: PAS domain-containing protein [bacterium]
MKKEISKYIANNLFDMVPYNIAIIDREYNIIEANKNFREYFGKEEKKKCYEVYKNHGKKCRHCQLDRVFDFGETIVSNESGIDKNGKTCHYVVHLAPVKNENDEIKYIIEMSVDITDTTRFQEQYNLLFERVPSYLTIIDKEFRIVRANKKFRDTFGDSKGKKCYEVYKKRKRKCRYCPAAQTFKDGQEHISAEVGKSFLGFETHYIVNTTPLSVTREGVQLVMEIATDISDLHNLEEQLRKAHDFYATLIDNAEDGILAMNENDKVEIINQSAKKILNWQSFKKPVLYQVKEMLPEVFFKENNDDSSIVNLNETKVKTSTGEDVPVRFNALKLKSKKKDIGKVAFIQDLRPIIELEKKKLEAERLGAVGQTVAGLAHTIKNLLMGLEGGMYIVDIGLRKGDATRIVEGWEILQKNFYKTTNLVKGFLSFAKGKLPTLELTEPNKIIEEIIELYKETAKSQNVKLIADLQKDLKPALLDHEGIEACLTNLLSNAIDAAVLREDKKGEVILRTKDKDDLLIFEVIDNGCGMEAEVLKNVFTTFFTTKGSKGTGLGLLTTNKIIIEHGGKIEVNSDVGEGSIFRISLSRKTLELLASEILN